MITPTIHLNGTSRDELVRQYTAALDAIFAAIEAVNAMAPNGRDYYPQGDDAYSTARREHIARMAKLSDLYEEVSELAVHVAQPLLSAGE
jgi:hypothetical protein